MGRKVLVVDDEEEIRGYVAAVLRKEGYTVVEAEGLVEARTALAAERFDVVVSDIGLRDGDGVSFLPHVASVAPSTRVVICTGHATYDEAVRALHNGAYDFLAKPVNRDTLISAVRRAVEAKHLEEENAILLYRLAEKVRALQQMLVISREVSGSLELQVVLSRALDRTLEFMGAEAGSILLCEEDGSMRFAVVRGGPAPARLVDTRLARGQGVAGWVVEKRRPLVVNDTSRDPRFSPAADEITGWHTWRVLATPLRVKDRIIGVLEVINGAVPFTREHRIAAETLSFPIAAAIENASMTGMLVEQSALLERRVWERTAELRASNEQLADTNRMLEETRDQMVRAEKMASIGCIAAGVAHEINNPIGFINSNLQTMRGYVADLKPIVEELRRVAPPDPEREKRIAEADLDFVLSDVETLVRESEDGVKRVVKIVKDLKTFSRADSSAPEEADLNACVEAALNLTRNETKYAAEVATELAPLPKVLCWPGQITQVLVNLIVNAAHAVQGFGETDLSAAEPGAAPARQGRIVVCTRAAGEWLELSVEDNGCGIPDGIATRIFDPFFTTKEPGRGTGLGLSLSYEIVERHRGEIEFDSEVGRGTRFVVRIPAAGVQPQVAGTAVPRDLQAMGPSRKRDVALSH